MNAHSDDTAGVRVRIVLCNFNPVSSDFVQVTASPWICRPFERSKHLVSESFNSPAFVACNTYVSVINPRL